ncbi:hypothetical protein ND447_07240 [Yersinia ruckeri]|uniref:hypothetical protein n=1 Tax=Yersinia ruckeri TaxID=29486 RepID=UPI0022651C4E|nr:hypothetical protein [Yersinia ruckeri]UZX73109.1 hypothetical protein ND447_07240 [Yersinia ruckeri]
MYKTKNTEIDNYDKDKFFEIGGEDKDNHSDSYEISHRTELTGRDIHITSGNNMQILVQKLMPEEIAILKQVKHYSSAVLLMNGGRKEKSHYWHI